MLACGEAVGVLVARMPLANGGEYPLPCLDDKSAEAVLSQMGTSPLLGRTKGIGRICERMADARAKLPLHYFIAAARFLIYGKLPADAAAMATLVGDTPKGIIGSPSGAATTITVVIRVSAPTKC